MVSDELIDRAGQILASAARSPATVILFGSRARRQSTAQSDLDFLVIERDPPSRLEEMVRLRDALPPLGVPVDVLVVSERQVEEWRDVHGTMVHAALSEGRVLVEP